jgi:transposase InsO family protein
MKIKILQSNNGKKFMSKKVDAFLGERGIQQQISASYSPQ